MDTIKDIKIDFVACNKCEEEHKHFYRMCFGDLKNSKIMIIGQSPSFPINQNTYPFDWTNVIGTKSQASRLFDIAFKEEEFNKNECYVTNAIKCGFKNFNEKQSSNCRFLLDREIDLYNGFYILAVGQIARKLLNGNLNDYTDYGRFRVFSVHHPSFYLKTGEGSYFVNSIKQFISNVKKYGSRQKTILDFVKEAANKQI